MTPTDEINSYFKIIPLGGFQSTCGFFLNNLKTRLTSLFQHKSLKQILLNFFMHRVGWRTVKKWVGVSKKSEMVNNFY